MTQFSSSFRETYPFTDMAPQFALAANVSLNYTVPGDTSKQYRASFSWPYDAKVWVGYNSTPTVPTPATMSSNTRCELNPHNRYVRGGDVLTFISGSLVTDAGFSLLKL